MSDTYYLFFGIASEYVLNPLYHYMRGKNFNCIEIDLLTTPDAKSLLRSLKGKSIVFVTSAHLFLDQYNLDSIQEHAIDIISPLEVMDYLKPIKSFLIPHDLTTLFHEQDMPWLDLFDGLLIPLPCPPDLASHPNVVNVGWIKRNKSVEPIRDNGTQHAIGFALSNFTGCIPLGPAKTYAIWQPILTQGVAIKFPHWHQDNEFEQYFAAQGVKIFNSRSDISEFIDMHSIILTNTFSSVNSEVAFAGREVINILNPDTADLQKKMLHKLPNIRFMTIEECAEYIAEHRKKEMPLKLVPPQIKPFDFELALQCIIA